MTRYIILGSGVAAAGAVYASKQAGIMPTIYEKDSHIGGHTASHVVEGKWTFDEGPHISFTRDARIQELFSSNIKGEFETKKCVVNNYWKGHWIKHPAQVNLHGLPADLICKILIEISNLPTPNQISIRTYEDWLRASYGNTFSELFPMAYARKYHTTDASNLSTEWIGPRLYQPSLDEVIMGALGDAKEVHYITEFRYPRRGGFASYVKPFFDMSDIRLNHKVVGIDHRNTTIYFAGGVKDHYDKLLSSLPLPELISILKEVPKDVREAASLLACTELMVVTIGVDRSNLLDANWSYFYDEDIVFSRLSTPHLQSSLNAPEGCGIIQAECYYSRKYRPLAVSQESLIDSVISDLRRCGILRENDQLLFKNVLHIKYANVIFDHETNNAKKIVHEFLDTIGLGYCGRYGDWEYYWTDQAFISGEKAAKAMVVGI